MVVSNLVVGKSADAQHARFQERSSTNSGAACLKCGSTERATRWQTFADGTRHLRVECGTCGVFICYAKQNHKRKLQPTDDAREHRDVSRGPQGVVRRQRGSVPAVAVFKDLEEALTAAVASDPTMGHDTAGRLTDHVLEVFEDVRQQHGIGEETELLIATPTRDRARVFRSPMDQQGTAG